MARVVCIANQKGGVGKTTTAINLATGMAMAGQKTLLIDLDPQCNATTGLGELPTSRHPLVECGDLAAAIIPTRYDGLRLLPGSRSFQDVDSLARLEPARSKRVTEHLAASLGGFDYVWIDCPPSLGTLTEMALSAASEVFMPIQCEYFAMEGLAQMIEVIRRVMAIEGSRLTFGGILLTMYDPNLELTHEVDEEVRNFFGEIVLDPPIPRDVAAAEAPSHGRAVIDFAPRSRATRAYLEICQEVLERV